MCAVDAPKPPDPKPPSAIEIPRLELGGQETTTRQQKRRGRSQLRTNTGINIPTSGSGLNIPT